MKILVYGYGGGHYKRFAAEVGGRPELHKALDEALDQGFTIFSITLEESKP